MKPNCHASIYLQIGIIVSNKHIQGADYLGNHAELCLSQCKEMKCEKIVSPFQKFGIKHPWRLGIATLDLGLTVYILIKDIFEIHPSEFVSL